MNLPLIASVIALLISFFIVGVILGAVFSKPFREKLVRIVRHRIIRRDLFLARVSLNPIIRPNKNPWEAEAVFNPAALFLGSKTHLIYRAIGNDGVSRLGYAGSKNGIAITERLPYPVFTSQNPRKAAPFGRHYAPLLYPSGGSWGGCEDPRAVVLDGRVYVTFSLFDGWDFIRMAAISLREQDFLSRRFDRWEGPTLLSPPGQVHKNWVLFPERIHGKIAILHSVSPHIDIAYRDRIEDIGTAEPFVESWVGARDRKKERPDCWDSFVRGAGPPPIRTSRGWLVLYHAINKHEPSRYKLGAMLLDLQDPTKILFRSKAPILMPDESYENDGKPGVVYACGAVVRDGTLYVYYGGADKVVCVAFAPLEPFLDALVAGEEIVFEAEPLTVEEEA